MQTNNLDLLTHWFSCPANCMSWWSQILLRLDVVPTVSSVDWNDSCSCCSSTSLPFAVVLEIAFSWSLSTVDGVFVWKNMILLFSTCLLLCDSLWTSGVLLGVSLFATPLIPASLKRGKQYCRFNEIVFFCLYTKKTDDAKARANLLTGITVEDDKKKVVFRIELGDGRKQKEEWPGETAGLNHLIDTSDFARAVIITLNETDSEVICPVRKITFLRTLLGAPPNRICLRIDWFNKLAR